MEKKINKIFQFKKKTWLYLYGFYNFQIILNFYLDTTQLYYDGFSPVAVTVGPDAAMNRLPTNGRSLSLFRSCASLTIECLKKFKSQKKKNKRNEVQKTSKEVNFQKIGKSQIGNHKSRERKKKTRLSYINVDFTCSLWLRKKHLSEFFSSSNRNWSSYNCNKYTKCLIRINE